ncbi:hypothetical protein BDR04DRAFT_607778 [Suillus decipiens]|nr:hypothetical protein BDR04DRAFT_607778 [Suillus decipiens]
MRSQCCMSRMIYSVYYHSATSILTFPWFYATMSTFPSLSVPCIGTHLDYKHLRQAYRTMQPSLQSEIQDYKQAFGSVESLLRRLSVTSSPSVLFSTFPDGQRITTGSSDRQLHTETERKHSDGVRSRYTDVSSLVVVRTGKFHNGKYQRWCSEEHATGK